MAFSSSSPEEDLLCPVCQDIFQDPVVLNCSHSFCKSCLHEFWNHKGYRECPVCRRTSSNPEPPCNRALKNLCDSFLQQRHQSAPVLQRPAVLCIQHNEKLQLFCLEDKVPICLVCQVSKTHRSHRCVPIDEAAQDHKEELQIAQVPLKEKLKAFNEMKQICDETADHIMSQVQKAERDIKKEFERLHQFLHKDEATRIAALKKEGKQKSLIMQKKIAEMDRLISSISDTIRTIEKELRAEDISFLQNFKTTIIRAKSPLPTPRLVTGALIDEAKHLGNLPYRVWEKMQEIVKHSTVVLDPNTAHSCLCLTDDLTSVRCSDQNRQLPENPERSAFYADVLGSEGFLSGRHSWEVVVGEHPNWYVGVVQESADRKAEIKRTPRFGIWEIGCTGSKYVATGEPINLTKRPDKIRVQLDYDRGEVSFSDPKDMKVLFTCTHTFTERMYPLFSVGMAKDNTQDLQICQSKVFLKVVPTD